MDSVTFTPVFRCDGQKDEGLKLVTKEILLHLGLIEMVAFDPLTQRDFYQATEKARENGSDGTFWTVWNVAQLLDPDYVNEVLTKEEEDILRETERLWAQPEPPAQRTSESTVLAAILSILPDAEIGQDNDGQIVIYTGLREVEFTSAPVYAGRFNLPAKGLGEAPEGYTRVMVLDDGETFSGLEGCTIKDVVSEDLSDVNDIDDLDPEAWSFVARFDANGVQV